MNKQDQGLIHDYFYQDETNKDGIFCKRREAKRRIYSGWGGSEYGVASAYYGSELWFHDTLIALYMPHPKVRDRFLVLVRAARSSSPAVYFEDDLCSNTTRDFLTCVSRAIPPNVDKIEVPVDLAVDKANHTTKAGLYAVTKQLITEGADRIEKMLDDNMQAQQNNVWFIKSMMDSMRKANEVFASSIPKPRLARMEAKMNKPYQNRIVNGHLCTSLDDYLEQRRKTAETLNEINRQIYRAQNDLQAVDNMAESRVGNRWEGYVSRMCAEVANQMQLTEESAVELNPYWQTCLRSLRWDDMQTIKKAFLDCIPPDIANKLRYGAVMPRDLLFINHSPGATPSLITSRHVRLAGAAFAAACAFAKAVAAGKNIVGKHIGPYVVHSQSEETIQVGCHLFDIDHVRFFSENYRLSAKEYRDKLTEYDRTNIPGNAKLLFDAVQDMLQAKQQLINGELDSADLWGDMTKDEYDALQAKLDNLRKLYQDTENAIKAANVAKRKEINKAKKIAAREAKKAKATKRATKKETKKAA